MRTFCVTIFCIIAFQLAGQRIAKFVISPGAGTYIQNNGVTVHYIFNDQVTGYVKGADGSQVYAGFLSPVFSTFSTSTRTSARPALQIFPNPVASQLNIISGSIIEEAVIHLIDLNGRVVWYGKGYLSDYKINTEMLAGGIYLLKIVYRDGNFEFHKLIKK